MSLIEGLLIFFTVVLLYFIIVIFLQKKGVLEKYSITLYGPALLLRTNKGKKFLDRLAQKKRFWTAFGSFGIIFCFIVMIFMVFILIWQTWAILGFGPEQKEAIPGPEVALVLPGINPILPLEYIAYIMIGLIVAIIAHEFSHGIMTLANKMKVKSLGILYLIVPIGAFCEPDEEEMKKTETGKRMRVYAAGPLSNFVVVIISLMLFSLLFISSVQPTDVAAGGLGVVSLHPDSPAEKLGIKPGAIITSINGTDLSQYPNFSERFDKYIEITNKTKANETITISYSFNNVIYNKNITLTDRYNYFISESNRAKGYTGIWKFYGVKENLDILKNPLTEKFPVGFLVFYVIPLTGYYEGYNPIISPFTQAYTITGPLGFLPSGVFFAIVNTLYWIFWLNLAVGLFNVLPMIPLDGGFLFNDAIGSFVKRIKKDISEERKSKIVKNISIIISLSILFAIIFPFIIKYI